MQEALRRKKINSLSAFCHINGTWFLQRVIQDSFHRPPCMSIMLAVFNIFCLVQMLGSVEGNKPSDFVFLILPEPAC